MSISDTPGTTDFDAWIALETVTRGPFTAHAVLLRDGETSFEPLCGTWLDIGGEAEWGEMVLVFAGSGMTWDAVAFFAAAALLDNPAARTRMQALETALESDPRLLGEAEMFDPGGRRIAAGRLG